MNFPVRRVVTGHDANGRAVVVIDEVAANVISRRPGHSSQVVWTSESFPVNNDAFVDNSKTHTSPVMQNGTVFRIIRYEPGVQGHMHRTDSLDYAVVLAGEPTLRLDDQEIPLKPGDVVVQRGTNHDFSNNGKEVALFAIVLISAKPPQVGDKVLNPTV